MSDKTPRTGAEPEEPSHTRRGVSRDTRADPHDNVRANPRAEADPESPPSEGIASPADLGDLEDQAMPDRGMPDLGQLGGRPKAWWVTPLAIGVVVIVGAIWTVHGFLARHDAAAKARRDAALDPPTQGREFGDEPASAASAVSPASAVGAVSAVGATGVRPSSSPAAPAPRSRMTGPGAVSTRSYYDAPLILSGGEYGQASVLESGLANAPTNGLGHPPENTSGNASGSTSGNPSGSASPAIRGQADGALGQALTPTLTPRVSAGTLGNRSLILAQGAKIDCAGDTAFDSSEAGLSTCTVTQNVYSDDGRVVLIERGSQIDSQYRSNLSPGQQRVFILAARIKTPNGVIVEIDSPAADALGRMGIGGYVDNHWGERIGAAMLLGLTQDAIGYLATRGGNGNSSVVFENTQQSGSDMATRVLDSTINIPPTLTQNQGAEFTIVVARDLDFSRVYALQPEEKQ